MCIRFAKVRLQTSEKKQMKADKLEIITWALGGPYCQIFYCRWLLLLRPTKPQRRRSRVYFTDVRTLELIFETLLVTDAIDAIKDPQHDLPLIVKIYFHDSASVLGFRSYISSQPSAPLRSFSKSRSEHFKILTHSYQRNYFYLLLMKTPMAHN